jgi:two-component system phosphate regulon sensor histidine kinase PhoR
MQWDYWRLMTIISLSGFVGLLFGHMFFFMFVATFAYALWLQRAWFKLSRWLEKPKKYSAPTGDGVIYEVCREIQLISKQNQSRKKKLAGYLKRFQLATSALPDGIVVLGKYSEVDWVNGAAKELLGVQWPKDSGVRINHLIRDPEFQHYIVDPDASERAIIITSPLNSAIQLEVKIVNYMDSGRMLIARDMTQTVRLQNMRRDFVANVSHELRSPLTVLRGYLEMFSMEGSSPEQLKAALPVMKQQSERMGDMLEELLTLSRLETGEKELRRVPTNIRQMLQDIVKDATRLIQFNEQQITLDIQTDKWLLADADELRSAVSNLVFNAVKYTPAKCPITISWSDTSDKGILAVCDKGDGIADHHIDRLTERFYRVDSGRSQEQGGTGLGLAIVKHVLQRHDADLKIISELGHGAKFYCQFPKASLVDEPDV